MAATNIKSGDQVISDFLKTAEQNPGLDQGVVAAICNLVAEGKLSKKQLQHSLDSLRQAAEQPASGDQG
jgi:hypothetical protein